MVYRELGEYNEECGVLNEEYYISRGVKKMPKDNYRRILKGYEPVEPSTILEKFFYVLWCFLCGLKILSMRIRRRISGKSGGNK